MCYFDREFADCDWHAMKCVESSCVRSRSMCHLPFSCQPDNSNLHQSVSDGQLVEPQPTTCDSESSGIEQQLSNWKLSATRRGTQASGLTDSKPDQQLYCHLSSQMAVLQEKVDQQHKVHHG